MDAVIDKVLEHVGFSSQQKEEIKRYFFETLEYNLGTAFVNKISKEHIDSLTEYLKSHPQDQKAFQNWLNENLFTDTTETREITNNIVKSTLEEFFQILTKGMSKEKVQQLHSLLNSNINTI